MAATDKALGTLHQKLAEVLSEALDGTNVEGWEDPESGEVIEAQNIPPSASVLTVVAKFLKDNEVTCDVQQNDELADMTKRLREKQQKLSSADLSSIKDHSSFMGSA
jgi:hypothetical protein